jgi:hypothetical protein
MGEIHKPKAPVQFEFIVFLFNGLRGVRGLRWELFAAGSESA